MRKIKFVQQGKYILFPPLADFLDLIDLPKGLTDFARMISKHSGSPPPVSNKTINNIGTKGIKRQKFLDLIRFIIAESGSSICQNATTLSFFDLEFRRMLRMVKNHLGSGRDWILLFKNLETQDYLFGHRVKSFINQRFKFEMKAYFFKGSYDQKIDYVGRVYSECILADSSQIHSFFSDFLSTEEENKGHIIIRHREILGFCLTDFYFWLLANFELDIAEWISNEVQLTQEEQELVNNGLFSCIMPKYLDGEYVSTLSQLLDRWREIYSRKRLKYFDIVSISEFASLLPDSINSKSKLGEMTKEDIRRSKYRMFYAWRKGEKIPSDDKLTGFIKNILPPCQERDMWFIFAKIAMSIDRLYKKIEADNVFENDELVCLFQRYGLYHREVRNRAAC